MVITIENKVNTWLETLTYLVDNILCAKKSRGGYVFSNVFIENFDLNEDPFKTCCYTNKRGKLSILRKQYLNEDSLSKVFSGDLVEVSMIGGPKWGSTAGNKHCMVKLTVDHINKKVNIHFRNSDFFKKFLVDVYFVKEILSEVGIKDYTYSCYFENLTLRIPFVYLFLNQLYLEEGEEIVKYYLDDMNPLINDFINNYKKQLNKKISYKSLDRARRRMEELELYKILERYLNEHD